MNENSKISLVKKLEVTDLAGEKVMIDFSSGKYFLLKGAANEIWDCIKKDITVSEIEAHLLSVYDIDKNTCHISVIEFLEKLKAYQFIEVM
jgi:hypothetical protein